MRANLICPQWFQSLTGRLQTIVEAGLPNMYQLLFQSLTGRLQT